MNPAETPYQCPMKGLPDPDERKDDWLPATRTTDAVTGNQSAQWAIDSGNWGVTYPISGDILLRFTRRDPKPFTYHYPSGSVERRHLPPAISRVGWKFEPREGFTQDIAYYLPEQQRFH